MRRSDKGPDDALQMDLHGLLAQAFGEALGSVDDQPFMKAADAIAVDDCCPKLSAIFNAWVAWGQERRTIARVVPRRGCDDLVLAIRFGPDISSRPREDDMAKPGGSISGAGQFPIDGVLAQGRISSSAGHFMLRFRSKIWIIAVVFRPRNCRIHQ